MTTKAPTHPLIARSTEETLYRTATVMAFMASRSDPCDEDDEANFGRELILGMCVSTLLHESDRAARAAFKLDQLKAAQQDVSAGG
jgi:hypothetical protein